MSDATIDTTRPDASPAAADDTAGRTLLRKRDWAAAQRYWSDRAQQAPDDSSAQANLAAALIGAGEHQAAIEPSRAAIAANPADWAGWGMLGDAQFNLCAYDDAITTYAQAVRRAPDNAGLLNNLGCACREAGQPALAVQALAAAVALAPDNAEIRANHGLTLLAAGAFDAGFAEYEWRWRMPNMQCHDVDAPKWRGERLQGRRILVHEEGGYGDMLQFMRYVPMLVERGAEVVIRTDPPLLRLLSRMPGVSTVIPTGTEYDAAGFVDFASSVMSLPYAFGTTIETVPAAPYLVADPAEAALWEKRLAALCGTDLRMGLVWAGGARTNPVLADMDRRRSMPLAALAPLAGPGRSFVSLQLGPAATQAPPDGMVIHDLTADITDFADTAALVAGLDLVISVDTSTAHLAAGMGVPTLVLSRYDQCWRWLTGTEHSPWYACLRNLRQSRPGDWSGPVSRAAQYLTAWPDGLSGTPRHARTLR